MESFQGTCFEHVYSNVCQYAIVEEEVFKGLKYVSINMPRHICRNVLYGLKS
jgi:hypothetical protein